MCNTHSIPGTADQTFTDTFSVVKNKIASSTRAELPADFRRSALAEAQYDEITGKIGNRLRCHISNICPNYDAPLYSKIITIFMLLLHRYTSINDICIGVQTLCSSEDDTTFIDNPKTKIIKTLFNNNPYYEELLKQCLSEISDKSSEIYLADFLTYLKTQDEKTAIPQIPVFFRYQIELSDCVNLPKLTIDEILKAGTNPEMVILCSESSSEIHFTLVFNTNLFKKDSVNRFVRHFLNLIERVAENSGKRVSEYDFISEDELQFIKNFNQTEKLFKNDILIPEMLSRQASIFPDKQAFVINDQVITLGELNSRANKLANYLLRSGAGYGRSVAICLNRSIEYIVGILGILKSGSIYVPLDPSYPSEFLSSILNNCQPALLISEQSLCPLFSSTDSNLLLIDVSRESISNEIDSEPLISICSDDIFSIIYTSGTTGIPKGVECTYKGIMNRLFWVWNTYAFDKDDVCCHRTSFAFIDAIAELFSPLLQGIPLVVLTNDQVTNIDLFVQALFRYKVTRALFVPSFLHSFLSCKKEHQYDLNHLKFAFCSGEALTVADAKRFYQEFQSCRLVNIYGTTEVSADVTFHEIKKFDVDDVLKYFSKSVDLPKGTMGNSSIFSNISLNTDRITAPGVTIDELRTKFLSTEISMFPMTLENYFQKLYDNVLPYVINTASPTYIGHMTSALPDFVHDLSKLISQLNQNLVKIETAKSLVLLEREALAILHRSFYKFNSDFYTHYTQLVNMNLGLVTTGGTTANITALLTARNKLLFGTIENSRFSGKSIYSLMREKGYEDMTILGSHFMHYSMRKATSVLGLGIDSIMYVNCDQSGKIDINDLRDKIALCKKKKLLILAIVGIAGSTETGQIDPIDLMGDVAREHGIHFHVDAAWGGTTIFSERYKHKLNGIQKADSITFCGHKQLFLPQGISICLFKDPQQMQFASTPAVYQASPDTYDPGRFTLEGSRSAISLCLHAALRVIGKKGYEALVDTSIEKALFFAETIKKLEFFELIGYPELNIVNYRYIPYCYRHKRLSGIFTKEENDTINKINTAIQEHQFLKGETFVSKTMINYGNDNNNKVVVFRSVISNPLTTHADLYCVLEDQLKIARTFLDAEQIGKIEKAPPPPSPDADSSLNNSHELFISIGKPITNCKIYILDIYNKMAPIGVPGIIHVAGLPVSRGYHENPGTSGKHFIDNPFDSEYEQLFITGDRARLLSDGTIEFLGRADEQVKIEGNRIELSEVESLLMQSDSLKQCAVTTLADKSGKKQLIAFVVFQNDKSSIEDLRENLKKKLPSFMLPANYIVLDALPLTPNGKINKKALQCI